MRKCCADSAPVLTLSLASTCKGIERVIVKNPRGKQMVGVLMVAEKPSLARSLAEILSHKRCKRRGSACRACDVYEFEGTFPPGDKRGGSAAHFKMTSVCGHVMTLDFLPKYNKWDQVDPVSRYTGPTDVSSHNTRL